MKHANPQTQDLFTLFICSSKNAHHIKRFKTLNDYNDCTIGQIIKGISF